MRKSNPRSSTKLEGEMMSEFGDTSKEDEQYIRDLEHENADLQRHLNALLAEAERKAIPEGWKLVPIEPTAEMLRGLVGDKGYTSWPLAEVYRIMVTAAPEPEAIRAAAQSTNKAQ